MFLNHKALKFRNQTKLTSQIVKCISKNIYLDNNFEDDSFYLVKLGCDYFF